MVADCAPGFQLHGLCNMPEVRGLFRNNESLSVLPPAYPTFSFASAPIPPPPFPAGRGGIYSFLMQGASPLASPRLSRKRHGLNLRGKCPEGARPLCRLPTLPLVCFSAPIPPTPFPSGEGGDYKLILPGAPPPAPRHQTVYGTDIPCRCSTPEGGAPSLSPANPACSLLFCPPSPKGKDRPPTPFPAGRGDYKLILPGASPPAPRHQTVYGTDSPCRCGTPAGACPLGRLPTLPLALLLPPSPDPLPCGKGETIS